ncbi:MAG TPA: nitrogenase molybdenum-iron protein alpha chain [Capsulimonadaceae bacterium]|jgi:nitrogenase molybdenum-iron protein alpha chain
MSSIPGPAAVKDEVLYLPDTTQVVKEIIETYPPKIGRKRAKHIRVNDPDAIPEIEANVRTVPGLITQRGCCYAGCKGVVLGPIKDIVHIVHGPIGCSYYAWNTRRNLASKDHTKANYIQYAFSTDLQEDEIIFGGEKKLRAAIQEAYELFHPKAIAVFSTCPVGLIGDDVHAVARQAKAELGINIFGFSCEGYKGVSQSAGHHIANNGLFKNVVGIEELTVKPTNPFRINILGEYNIGGDAWEIKRILDRCGIDLICTFSGDVVYEDIAHSHTANLNLVMCYRSINYMADMMEKKFGIPWIKISFIGADSTTKTLRKIAKYFDDPTLTARVEAVIADELAVLQPVRDEIYSRNKGKVALNFVGGSRAHHYQDLFADMGMRTVCAGYEFAHRDDYEGSRVIPTIKIDADSRNIEEIEVDADPVRFNPRKTPEQLAALAEDGLVTNEYKGMMSEMAKGTLVVDDISHYEMEKLIEFYKPDVFCSGIKDKFVVEKMGVPTKQLHSYDYGGPYAGYRGAANFYKDIDMMIHSSVRRFLRPPWEQKPQLRAGFAVRTDQKKKG